MIKLVVKDKQAHNPDKKMSLMAHLLELRKRIMWALVGIVVGAIAGWFLSPVVLTFIQKPRMSISDQSAQLNFQTIGAAFDLRMRLAFWIGTIISSPWWITQIGMFVWPGLRRKERLFVAGFGLVGIVLFAAGTVAGVVVVPQAVSILVSFVPADAQMLLRADSYLSFYMTLVSAFGLSCLLPELLVALNFSGVLSVRTLLKAWRWAVVLCFVFAAIANPIPNPLPMIIQAAALIALYFLAVGICALREHMLAKRQSNSSRG